MVKVELPREVKGSDLLEKLEESAKELGCSAGRDCRGGYVIAPGSVKEKLTKLRLYITTSTPRKQKQNDGLLSHLWNTIFKAPIIFTSEVSINLNKLYKEIDMDVELDYPRGYLSTGSRDWEKIKTEFEKLIDGVYNKLK